MEKTLLSGPGGEGGEGPAAADLDAKIRAEAIRRGLITPAQGNAALEEARAEGVPLLDMLVRKSLLTEEAARGLDEEVKEDFVPGFRILSKLGEGGMGIVYRALQKRLDRVVALKVVMPHLAADPSYLKRFEREAKAVAKLNHPSIVAAYDYGEANGRVYLAMEYVEGSNAADRVRTSGPMPVDLALAVVRDVAAGLSHAHAAGILHRDVKPANILLSDPRPGETGGRTSSGAKITDLGLARSADGSSELTAAGAILGTPGYMAPEQAFGMEIDQRADIYALGATLYQLITGQRPFDASTPVAVIARQQTDLLLDPRDTVAGIPVGVVVLLQGMLSREPASRYPGWKEVLADLDRLHRGEMPLQAPPPPDHASIGVPLGLGAGATLTTAGDMRPGGTLISPPPASASSGGFRRGAAVATAAPASAPPAGKSKGPLLAVVAVVGVIAVAAVVMSLKGGKEGDGPGKASATGTPSPATPAAPEADPFPPEAEKRFEAAIQAGDDRAAVLEFLAAWTRLQALSPAGKKLHAHRGIPIERARVKVAEVVEGKFRALVEEGEYEQAGEAVRWVVGQMGDHTPPRVETFLLRLEVAKERGPDERRAFRAATEAREKGDPVAALDALDGYETKYDFSWRMPAAARLRAWAEDLAPLVTLTSDPAGATLVLDGKEIGLSPQTVRLGQGMVAVQARTEGRPPVSGTFTVERKPGQVFTLTFRDPDPVPRAGLVPAGIPRPLWNGQSLDGWVFGGGGQWGASDPAKKVFLEGAEKDEPAALLRGSHDGVAHLRRPLTPLLKNATAWKLEWQMFGEQRPGAAPTRVELQFGRSPDGAVLVLGIDGSGAFLGSRTADGVLTKTHTGPSFPGGKRTTFTLQFDGAVYAAEVDWKPLGAVAAPVEAAPDPDLRAAVEDGTGFFSDILLQPLK